MAKANEGNDDIGGSVLMWSRRRQRKEDKEKARALLAELGYRYEEPTLTQRWERWRKSWTRERWLRELHEATVTSALVFAVLLNFTYLVDKTGWLVALGAIPVLWIVGPWIAWSEQNWRVLFGTFGAIAVVVAVEWWWSRKEWH